MNIAAAVIKCREQESGHRGLYPPVPRALLTCIGRFIIRKTGLGELYRADAAEEVLVTSSSNLCLHANEIDGKPVGGKQPELLEKIRKALLDEFTEATND